MRILCVTSIFPNRLQPNRGIYNWRHFAQLQERAQVQVISPIAWTDDLLARRTLGAALSGAGWQDWEGVRTNYPRYYYPPGMWRGSYGAFLKSSIKTRFQSTLAEFRPDLVYACWAYPDGWAAWRLARSAGLPIVVKVHGSDLLLLDKSSARKYRTGEMLQDVDALVAVSDNLRKYAIRMGTPPTHAHVLYSGTDHNVFVPGDRQEARQELGLRTDGLRILFVGNLVPGKGVLELLEACERLARDGHSFEVDVVGEGPLRSSLAEGIATAGLSERVHLRGSKQQNELPPWYRASNLVVLPSHSEGLPNVLVEAAACGVPFVATNVGGIPEIAHLSPIPLVPPNDSHALAAAIERVLRDPAAAAAGVDRSLVPSVADCASATLDLFSNVLSQRGAARPVAASP